MIMARSSLVLSFRHFVQIHEHGYKRRLSVTGHQSDQLILDRLYPALNFVSQTAFHDLVNDIEIHDLRHRASLSSMTSLRIFSLLTSTNGAR